MLNPQITAATGWSTTATAAAFSGSLLVSALTGIPSGASSTAEARAP